MSASRIARFIVAAAGVAALAATPGVARAQTSIFGLKVEGDVELGGRVYADRPAPEKRAKLEEYRDLSEQPFGAFGIRLFRPDESYSTELRGLNVGQDDQEFALESGKPGLWRFDFDWNQIPHLYSTNGRLLETEGPRGVFNLPTPRPPLSAYNSARRLDEISQRWDSAHVEFLLTPTPFLDLNAEYTRIYKHGDKPMGMAMGSPGGNFVEILEPVDQTIHDFRLKAAWSGGNWQAQASYALSVFQNDADTLISDNPCFNLAACAGDAAGPARGRVSLAPDNMAHTISLAGGINLPMRTRLTGNLSYSLRLQDDTFLPHTINASVQSPLLTLPRNSLDGQVGIFLLNLAATTNPLPPLTVSGRFRLYDFDDMTDELIFPGHVVDDRPPVVDEARRATRFSYTKYNADLDGRWRFTPDLATTVGFAWERWDRIFHREVPNSDEYFGKLAIDATPLDWLLARLTYKPSFRRIDEYNTFAHQAHTVVEDVTPDAQAQGQSPLLRKFDEADRDRQRVDLLVQLTPIESLSITPTVSYYYDDYYNSTLGLQSSENWSAGFDLGWTIMKGWTASAGYVYETLDQKQRSRSRPVVGTATFDFPDFEWLSKNEDTYHTIRATLAAALIPDVLDLILEASYSFGKSEIKTSNPITPTSGTAAQRVTATAKPFPDVENKLLDLGASLRYRFAKAWSLGLGYLFEKFEQTNFRTDTLQPFNTGVTSIYLGNDFKDYTAHIITMTLGYRFD